MRTKKISPGLRAVVAVLAMTFVMSTWAAAQITVLHSFGNGNDGTDPADSLIFDGAGNLYGMTGGGGAKSEGTVFELKAPASPNGAWKYSVLHSFPANSTDGKFPNAGLTYDPSSGNLYGTAASGGAFGFGMVFEFTPVSGGNWKYNPHHVYDFANVATGEYPSQTLTVDKAGNLYGVTKRGRGRSAKRRRGGIRVVATDDSGREVDGDVVASLWQRLGRGNSLQRPSVRSRRHQSLRHNGLRRPV
jgi:uncharacterized repeat protein (TIGR03803 family)